jgi:myo-inositol 2-dehydrogenase / D-chiro-inositol 1-dehydrogenase
MIRVAVIGVGGMGACHARNIEELAGAEVAWVADPAEHVGRALATEVGAEWSADGHEALADCDAAVIACPDRFHARYVLDAIERDMPTLCEKPLTVELDDARRIVDAEMALGHRLVQVGFMRVYDERHQQVRDALRPLGTVHHVRCVHRNIPTEPRSLERILVESVIHDIHTVRWLSEGEIVEVSTAAVHRDGAVRFLVLTCRLADGGVATVEFDDGAAGYEVSIEATAERGNVVAAEPPRSVVRAAGSISSVIGDDWFAPFLGTYRQEMRSWLDSVDAGNPSGPTAWDGLAAQAVVAAAVSSVDSGAAETVALPPSPPLYRNENS